MQYASFGKRFLAYVVDGALVFIISLAVNRAIPFIGWMISLCFSFLYYTMFTCSEAQATPGKFLVKIKVTDIDGNRLTVKKSILRFFASWLSSILLCFGYILSLFTAKKQTLHDLIMDTVVIDGEVIVEGGILKAFVDQIKSLRQ